MARLGSQMEDMMGYPTGGDPSIIDPTTGKPYDDSSRMRQQAEITRQADATEAFQPVELPEYLKTKVEEKQSSPASEVSTDKLKTAYDDLVIPKKPLKRDSKGRPLESLRPKLRPTEDFGPSFNFKSPIDKTIELNYLLRDPNSKTKQKEIVSGLSEKTEEGERAVQGFYDSVAKGQGLSATEDAWCAAFVHYILTELGADTITSDGGYDAQRARKYVNYGSPIKTEDAREGDIVIFDWDGDGIGDHVSFHAGTRITDQSNSNKISVVGGNQDNKVSLITRDMSKVLGIRRITKDNINVSLSKDLAKTNPIFKLFVPAEVPAKDIKLKQGPRISNTQQADPFSVIPASFNEGDSVTRPNTYAQGGLTSMNDQTQMAFALGGEAETVDPVSGNDVPPGSLPEEVRDDIDAKLSEGEYVVPADVVRFFGVKYFEDLRMEAKMGLQQMDADGRIGGEPVQEQEQPQGQDDSMDVAELKAALSSSGMYAGGLTDGGTLDNFIDDASRSPMVNGRMRASGATVKMAVGGLAVGNFGDVTKVDGIIKQLMTAANKDPALMDKLASKGIMVNKTGADKKSAEMQQANKPQEPIEAAEGTLVQPRAFKLGGTTEADTSQQESPFNLSSFNTLGQNLFQAAGVTNPEKVVTDTFLNKEGKIEQIVLIAPDGSEVPVAWNTTMLLPPGFTRKATNDYGVKPAASVEASAVAAAPVDEKPRRTEDDSAVGARPTLTASGGEGFNVGGTEDYSNSTIEELEAHLTTTKKYTKAGYVASFALGPVGMLIGIATKANQAIVERRIENELKSRANKANTKNLRQINNLDNKALSEEEIDTLVVLQKSLRISNKLSKTGEIVATDNDGAPVGFNPVRSILNSVFEPMADRIDARVKAKRDAAGGIQAGVEPLSATDVDPMSLEQGMDPSARKAQQDLVTNSRLRREKLEREAEEEARRAAGVAADAQRVANNRTSFYTGDKRAGGGDYFQSADDGYGYTDASGTNQYLGGGSQGWTNPGNVEEKAQRDASRSYGGRADSTGYGGFGGRNTGGLVSAPAAKQKKKQTTQRRKGLGTRP